MCRLVCVPLAPLPVQVLRWSFLALRGDFNVSLAMHEEPAKMQIRTEMLQVGGSAEPLAAGLLPVGPVSRSLPALWCADA